MSAISVPGTALEEREGGHTGKNGQQRQQDIVEATDPGTQSQATENDNQQWGRAAYGGGEGANDADFQEAIFLHAVIITASPAF